ncbi:Uncharacterised protein [Mycobacteroides abscessus subsp. abscessus]|nr:Uncharacterised protein [Mycobacteroides abscessus subsp. abscessus]
MRLGDSHRRSEVCRLDEQRKAQLLDGVERHGARVVDAVAVFDPPALRDSRLRGNDLGHALVHARRRAEHTGADVGELEQLEHPLDGAVLAVWPVQ